MEQLNTSLINPSDRIYVAGHRGMVGSAVCRVLERNGHPNLLTASRLSLDLRDPIAVNNWFAQHRPQVVVVAAARVGGILANSRFPAEFLLDNLRIQNNVILAAWQHGTRRLLFLGSSCIYPKFAQQPIREESLLSGALEPTNQWYATAKICGIQLCRALRQQHDFDAISLMPTNLYGPGDNYHPENSHVLPGLIQRFHHAQLAGLPQVSCWGSGNPRREFLHVDDLADAVLHSLRYWRGNSLLDQDGEPLTHLNVGTGEDLSIHDLACMIAHTVGYHGELVWDSSKPDGTPRKLLDVSRLEKLGWRARIPLDEGLRSTYRDYLTEDNEMKLVATPGKYSTIPSNS